MPYLSATSSARNTGSVCHIIHLYPPHIRTHRGCQQRYVRVPVGFVKNNKLCERPPQYAPAPCKLTIDFLTLKVVFRVTCDASYLCVCANFSLSRPLCSRLRPDVRDRQTDVRRTSSLNATYPRGGGIIMSGTNALSI